MMDYLKEIFPFEDIGKTDAEIAEILGTITSETISPKAAKNYFRETELWQETPTGFEGKLQTAYENETQNHIPATLKALTSLWSAAFSDAVDSVETEVSYRTNGKPTGFQRCVQLFKSWGRMVNKGDVTQDDVDGFYELGGGLKHVTEDRPEGPTAQDVTDTRTAYNTAQALEAARNQLAEDYDAEFNAHVSEAMNAGNKPGVIAGLRDMATALEA